MQDFFSPVTGYLQTNPKISFPLKVPDESLMHAPTTQFLEASQSFTDPPPKKKHCPLQSLYWSSHQPGLLFSSDSTKVQVKMRGEILRAWDQWSLDFSKVGSFLNHVCLFMETVSVLEFCACASLLCGFLNRHSNCRVQGNQKIFCWLCKSYRIKGSCRSRKYIFCPVLVCFERQKYKKHWILKKEFSFGWEHCLP